MKKRSDPDLVSIRENIEYRAETDEFFWRKARSKIYPGKTAGSLHHSGYWVITVNQRDYQASMISWFLYYGFWPKGEIDHKDGDKRNNRPDNLRDVSHRKNCQNFPFHRNGKLVGASFEPQRNKWRARAKVHGRQVDLGFYFTAQEAHDVYLAYVGGLQE